MPNDSEESGVIAQVTMLGYKMPFDAAPKKVFARGSTPSTLRSWPRVSRIA